MPFAPVAGKEEAKLLYIKGFDIAQIAEQLSIKPDTVRQWVHRGRWARTRAACDSLAEWSGPQLQNAVAERFVTRVFGQADRLLAGIEALALPVTPRDMKDFSTALASTAATGRKALGLDDASPSLHVHYHGAPSLKPAAAPTPVIDIAADVKKTQ